MTQRPTVAYRCRSTKGLPAFVDCREQTSQLCDFADFEAATSSGHPYLVSTAFIHHAGASGSGASTGLTEKQVSWAGSVVGPFHHTACKQNFCLDAIECLRLLGLTAWVLADFGSITALHLCIVNLTMDQVLCCFRDNLMLPVNR